MVSTIADSEVYSYIPALNLFKGICPVEQKWGQTHPMLEWRVSPQYEIHV